ncbi:MAG: hypothetical protein WCI53_04110 [Bacteroidota bacterium]|jgi:hypothetical protein
MLKSVALKLNAPVFEETNKIVLKLNTNRNRYINEAVELYNQYNKKKLLKKQLSYESSITKVDSMERLAEFEIMIDGN